MDVCINQIYADIPFLKERKGMRKKYIYLYFFSGWPDVTSFMYRKREEKKVIFQVGANRFTQVQSSKEYNYNFQ